MGHQLLLCLSIPHQKYIQTVSTLRALTGVLEPQEIATYTLLTKPHNVFKPKFEPGKVNQIEQYYMKCTTVWDDEAAQTLDLAEPIVKDGPQVLVDRLFSGKQVNCWTLQVSDIPNAGKAPVLAHNYHESTLVHHHTQKVVVSDVNSGESGEIETRKEETREEEKKEEAKEENGADEFKMDIDSDLKVVEEKKTESVAVDVDEPKPDVMEIDLDLTTPNDMRDTPEKETPGKETPKETERVEVHAQKPQTKDLFLQFIEDLGYDVVNQYWLKGIRFFYGDIIIEIFKLFVRHDDGEIRDDRLLLNLLDETNTFQIKAYIDFPKGASVDLVNQGTKDLTRLKELLKNLFELEVPDRMYMDSRLPRVN